MRVDSPSLTPRSIVTIEEINEVRATRGSRKEDIASVPSSCNFDVERVGPRNRDKLEMLATRPGNRNEHKKTGWKRGRLPVVNAEEINEVRTTRGDAQNVVAASATAYCDSVGPPVL